MAKLHLFLLFFVAFSFYLHCMRADSANLDPYRLLSGFFDRPRTSKKKREKKRENCIDHSNHAPCELKKEIINCKAFVEDLLYLISFEILFLHHISRNRNIIYFKMIYHILFSLPPNREILQLRVLRCIFERAFNQVNLLSN